MRFEELPYEVQVIAANTLSDRFPLCGSSKSNGFEPATALARDVKAAFTELYSPDEASIKKSSIAIDASEAVNQISELLESLKLKSFESVSEHIINLLLNRGSGLFDYIVFSDSAAAVGATDINEIVVKIKVVGPTDKLAAAIRAGNLQSFSAHGN